MTRAQVNAVIRRQHKEEQIRTAQNSIARDQAEYERFTKIASYSPKVFEKDYWETNLQLRDFKPQLYGVDEPNEKSIRKTHLGKVLPSFKKQPYIYTAIGCLCAAFWISVNYKAEKWSFPWFAAMTFLGAFYLHIPLSIRWWWLERKKAIALANSDVEKQLVEIATLRAEHPNKEEARIAEESKLQGGDLVLLEKGLNAELETFADEVAELEHSFETEVSFDIVPRGPVYIDVDLPEIENVVKAEVQTVLKSGRISEKAKNKKTQNQEYAEGIIGIAFNLAAHAFNVSPAFRTIIVSGYTQRIDKRTGKLADDYVYSIRFERDAFSKLNLGEIDPIHAVAGFEHRMELSKASEFKAIEPWTPPNADKSAS